MLTDALRRLACAPQQFGRADPAAYEPYSARNLAEAFRRTSSTGSSRETGDRRVPSRAILWAAVSRPGRQDRPHGVLRPPVDARAAGRRGFAISRSSGTSISSAATRTRSCATSPGRRRATGLPGCDTPGDRPGSTARAFDAVLVMGWHLKCYWQAIVRRRSCRGLPVLVRGDRPAQKRREAPRDARLEGASPIPDFCGCSTPRSMSDSATAPIIDIIGCRKRGCSSRRICMLTPQRFRSGATEVARTLMRRSLGVARDDKLWSCSRASSTSASKRPFDLLDGDRKIARRRRTKSPRRCSWDPARRRRNCAPTHGARKSLRISWAFATSRGCLRRWRRRMCSLFPRTGGKLGGWSATRRWRAGFPLSCLMRSVARPTSRPTIASGAYFRRADIDALASALSATLAEPADKAAIARVCDRHSLEAAADGIVRCNHIAVTQGSAKARDARVVRSSAKAPAKFASWRCSRRGCCSARSAPISKRSRRAARRLRRAAGARGRLAGSRRHSPA